MTIGKHTPTSERTPPSWQSRARASANTIGSFFVDAVLGLSSRPKRIAPKYFYDHDGSILFEKICAEPEYYVTRTELSILERSAAAIAAALPPRCRVVEPGAGNLDKTRLLLRALGPERCLSYVPIDISRRFLSESVARLEAELPWLQITPVAADFSVDVRLPPPREDGAHTDGAPRDVPTVIFFPGSTIGNFEPEDAERLLGRFRAMMGPRGALLLGVDLKKSPGVIQAAYNDARGVTARFDKNLLLRMNRELGANFDVEAFDHHAFYDPTFGRVEMHLVARTRQNVNLAGTVFTFEAGESIRTERSYKYEVSELEQLARRVGLRTKGTWFDARRYFAVVLLGMAH